MNIEKEILNILADLLDVPLEDITPETYIIRELDAESVDLLELSVTITDKMGVPVKDELLFLSKLREYAEKELEKAEMEDGEFLLAPYPFLDKIRAQEIMEDLSSGPVLKVKDMVAYISSLTQRQEDDEIENINKETV